MRTRHYWLLKSEPDVFSFEDLLRAPAKTTCWDGVRNYQARNLLRDELQPGDGVLFYLSNAKPTAAVGIAEVVRGGYPDHTALDPKSPYFDPKGDAAKPVWYMVDIRAVKRLPRTVTLDEMRGCPALKEMVLLANSRLSVQPVRPAEWAAILKLAGL